MNVLPVLQVINALSWLIPFVLFLPALRRCLFGKKQRRDGTRAAVFFVSAIFIGYAIRWLVFPSAPIDGIEVTVWAGLYVLSIIASPLLTYTVYFDE